MILDRSDSYPGHFTSSETRTSACWAAPPWRNSTMACFSSSVMLRTTRSLESPFNWTVSPTRTRAPSRPSCRRRPPAGICVYPLARAPETKFERAPCSSRWVRRIYPPVGWEIPSNGRPICHWSRLLHRRTSNRRSNLRFPFCAMGSFQRCRLGLGDCDRRNHSFDHHLPTSGPGATHRRSYRKRRGRLAGPSGSSCSRWRAWSGAGWVV